jgi:hypothetical protein
MQLEPRDVPPSVMFPEFQVALGPNNPRLDFPANRLWEYRTAWGNRYSLTSDLNAVSSELLFFESYLAARTVIDRSAGHIPEARTPQRTFAATAGLPSADGYLGVPFVRRITALAMLCRLPMPSQPGPGPHAPPQTPPGGAVISLGTIVAHTGHRWSYPSKSSCNTILTMQTRSRCTIHSSRTISLTGRRQSMNEPTDRVGDWWLRSGSHLVGQASLDASSLYGPQRAIIRDGPLCGFVTLPSATPRLWYLVGSRARCSGGPPAARSCYCRVRSRGESTRTYDELQSIVGWVVHTTLMV